MQGSEAMPRLTSETIRACMPGDEASYADRCWLTFDIDWACDEVIEDTVDLVEDAGVAATWFVTHDTPLLDRLRDNPRFELGIHPNFNPLLTGTSGKDDIGTILRGIREIVPEATAVRSHSMVQSSRLLQEFQDHGLTHDCNTYIPSHSGISMRAWRIWNGLVRVPHVWEDDAHCLDPAREGVRAVLDRPGLRVFDFHPIHVFLNTEDLSRYETTRTVHRDPARLLAHRHEGLGTRTELVELLSRLT